VIHFLRLLINSTRGAQHFTLHLCLRGDGVSNLLAGVIAKASNCQSGNLPAEMRGYRFLISTSYPYPLKTIRIRILSVCMILLWYNYTASQKNSHDIFDCKLSAYSRSVSQCHARLLLFDAVKLSNSMLSNYITL